MYSKFHKIIFGMSVYIIIIIQKFWTHLSDNKEVPQLFKNHKITLFSRKIVRPIFGTMELREKPGITGTRQN